MMSSLGIKPTFSFRAAAHYEPNDQHARRVGITDVAGIRVGHFTDSRRPTGCTASLSDGEVTVGSITMALPQVRICKCCSSL